MQHRLIADGTHRTYTSEDPQHHIVIRPRAPSGPQNPKRSLLANGQKQTVAHITQPRLQHAPGSQLLIQAGDVDLDALGPLARGPREAGLRAQDAEDDDPLGAPLAQGLDGGGAGAAGGDDGVDDDGEARGFLPATPAGGDVLGQVVVVLDGLEGRGLAVQAQVVHGDGAREERLHGVDHAQPRAQDGHYGQGLGLDRCRLVLEAQGGLVLFSACEFTAFHPRGSLG